MDIEVRHLQALVAVAEAGTFGKAAEALGFTQSAVSQQIAALERAVGSPVFDRPGGPRPVRLTPVGEVLLNHAQGVLAALRGAAADVEAIARGDRAASGSGSSRASAPGCSPACSPASPRSGPGCEIVLHEAHNPHELLDMVRSRSSTSRSARRDAGARRPVRLAPRPGRSVRAARPRHARVARPAAHHDRGDRQPPAHRQPQPHLLRPDPVDVRGPGDELRLPLRRQLHGPGLRGGRPRSVPHAAAHHRLRRSHHHGHPDRSRRCRPG